jgi:hypothetical protein
MWSHKTSHYDDALYDFSSCLVLTFLTGQFPMISNKHLGVLSFLLVCDVVWMGLLAQHCPFLLTSVRLLLLLCRGYHTRVSQDIN